MTQVSRKDLDRLAANKREKVKLPGLWKLLIYIPLGWAILAGNFYVSGLFASEVGNCTVVITKFDDWMATSIMFAGILGFIALAGGMYFLENK